MGRALDRVRAELCLRIAELREERQLTQAQLAERAGLSLRYVQTLEAGEGNCTLEALVAVAGGLDSHVRELFVQPTLRRRRRRGRPKKSS